MKVATILFNSLDSRRAYQDALRKRMYWAGYEPHQVTEYLRLWFPSKKLTGFIAGTDDAERAKDVANEVRGVMVKLKEEP
jgi:hypothetical protein